MSEVLKREGREKKGEKKREKKRGTDGKREGKNLWWHGLRISLPRLYLGTELVKQVLTL